MRKSVSDETSHMVGGRDVVRRDRPRLRRAVVKRIAHGIFDALRSSYRLRKTRDDGLQRIFYGDCHEIRACTVDEVGGVLCLIVSKSYFLVPNAVRAVRPLDRYVKRLYAA
ncbi:MAG: hypothetical protein QOK37_772 [Thermoanaerobaculia bacterium]|nr:hypothetical protein [Thermoanaerobaculia bacterium]